MEYPKKEDHFLNKILTRSVLHPSHLHFYEEDCSLKGKLSQSILRQIIKAVNIIIDR